MVLAPLCSTLFREERIFSIIERRDLLVAVGMFKTVALVRRTLSNPLSVMIVMRYVLLVLVGDMYI